MKPTAAVLAAGTTILAATCEPADLALTFQAAAHAVDIWWPLVVGACLLVGFGLCVAAGGGRR